MGVKYVMWFDVGVEGKSGGGGFGRQDIADFFLLLKTCVTCPHVCAGRVMGVVSFYSHPSKTPGILT
jgi:hypothetical protein